MANFQKLHLLDCLMELIFNLCENNLYLYIPKKPNVKQLEKEAGKENLTLREQLNFSNWKYIC
jgi:hypothetical protein